MNTNYETTATATPLRNRSIAVLSSYEAGCDGDLKRFLSTYPVNRTRFRNKVVRPVAVNEQKHIHISYVGSLRCRGYLKLNQNISFAIARNETVVIRDLMLLHKIVRYKF